MKNWKNLELVKHPVLQHHLTILRKVETDSVRFRYVLSELSHMLVYEATRGLRTEDVTVKTPFEEMKDAKRVSDRVAIVSIMRAGNGMLEAAARMLPFAQSGHVGIYRDKNIESTVEYFFRIPDEIADCKTILLDPLLATGETAVSAVSRLKEYGAKDITFLCVLAAPKGLDLMQEKHPDVRVVAASVERELTDSGYIVPGIGDAGDRLYGTIKENKF